MAPGETVTNDALPSASRIVALTGAGMSAESGVPTFRDAQTGLWEQYDPEELATPSAWRRDPALVWGWYRWRAALVAATRPNPGHELLARHGIEVITQNVDDLHERAGSESVIHLHGSLFSARCFACARPHSDSTPPAGPSDVPLRVNPPRCSHCGGRVRPDVVWFGERIPADALRKAETSIRTCEVLLVIGTSGLVNPAAQLPALAQRADAKVIEINPDVTELSVRVDQHLRMGAVSGLREFFGTDSWA